MIVMKDRNETRYLMIARILHVKMYLLYWSLFQRTCILYFFYCWMCAGDWEWNFGCDGEDSAIATVLTSYKGILIYCHYEAQC